MPTLNAVPIDAQALDNSPGVDQILLDADVAARAADPVVAKLIAFARDKEVQYTKIKLLLNDALAGTFRPYLAASPALADTDLEQMVHSSGWAFSREKFGGAQEEYAMWLDRFRRFAALVLSIPKF